MPRKAVTDIKRPRILRGEGVRVMHIRAPQAALEWFISLSPLERSEIIQRGFEQEVTREGGAGSG